METDSSSEEERLSFTETLKVSGYQRTSKRVWKYGTEKFTLTLIGVGEDPETYDPRCTDFTDQAMRVVWKEILKKSPENPGKLLVEWVENNQLDIETTGYDTQVSIGDDSLNIVLQVKPTERKLTIYTYGIARRKHKPDQSQRNWFVGTITARSHGVDLRKFDGRSEEVQSGISSDVRFTTIMNSIVSEIETNNYSAISVSCTKGRHRSVAVAELLKKWFYPNAAVVHLTIN